MCKNGRRFDCTIMAAILTFYALQIDVSSAEHYETENVKERLGCIFSAIISKARRKESESKLTHWCPQVY